MEEQLERTQRRRRVLTTTGLAAIATALVLTASALPGGAAVPPFDATFNVNCLAHFGIPGGNLVEKTTSISGTGPLRTVNSMITYPGVPLPLVDVVDCIAIGDTTADLVESITVAAPPAAGLPVSFTVGLQGSGADITIEDGDRICDAARARNAMGSEGTSLTVCTEPITFGTPATTTTTQATTTTTAATTTTTTAATTTTTAATTTSTTAAPTTTTSPTTSTAVTSTTIGGSTSSSTQAPTTSAETTTTSVASTTSVGQTTTTSESPTTTGTDGTTTSVVATSSLPSTGGGLNPNVLGAAVLTLLAGVLALLVARRQAM